MTPEQIEKLRELADAAKTILPDVTGSLTFHLVAAQPVPKVDVTMVHVTRSDKK